LDDLAVVATFYFPRAVHYGQGVFQAIIDERAEQDQRDALLYILSGQDQPTGTVFEILSAMTETVNEPLFAKIDFEWDLEKRRGRVGIGDVVRAYCEPLRNPITDQELQMITVNPGGWIFHEGENVSGFAKGLGAIKFNLFRCHSSLAQISWNQDGLV